MNGYVFNVLKQEIIYVQKILVNKGEKVKTNLFIHMLFISGSVLKALLVKLIEAQNYDKLLTRAQQLEVNVALIFAKCLCVRLKYSHTFYVHRFKFSAFL